MNKWSLNFESLIARPVIHLQLVFCYNLGTSSHLNIKNHLREQITLEWSDLQSEALGTSCFKQKKSQKLVLIIQ